MVVMPEVESSVQLYNQCSQGLVKVNPDGKIFANLTNFDSSVNMIMRSYNHSAILTIFNPETKKYLCFNRRGKLVGKKYIDDRLFHCYFKEGIENKYHQFHSIGNQAWSIGFLTNGKPVGFLQRKRGLTSGLTRRKLEELRKKGCFNFTKMSSINVEAHNRQISKNPPKVSYDEIKEFFKYQHVARQTKYPHAIRHRHAMRHRNRTNKM